FGETGERGVALAQKVADLAARRAPFLAGEPLCGVRKHELVRFFDGIAACGEPGQRHVAWYRRQGLLGRWRHAVVTSGWSAGSRRQASVPARDARGTASA